MPSLLPLSQDKDWTLFLLRVCPNAVDGDLATILTDVHLAGFELARESVANELNKVHIKITQTLG